MTDASTPIAAIVATTLLLFALPAGAELGGTSWRLVGIASMDDSTWTPQEPDRYTLELRGDRSVAIAADCNRGDGTWASDRPGQLRFGPLATTRALCPPESLSERYLEQFPWVRSYVIREGHLFLATMADGSIIEFEPLAGASAITATVLEEPIRTGEVGELRQAILGRLFDRYAAEHDIESKRDEVDTFVGNLREGIRENGLDTGDDLTEEEAVTLETMRRDMGAALIRQWKINRSLFETYGGRIIYQQFGPEPLDAYRRFLLERRDAGDFSINDPTLADAFWGYFTDDDRHDFMATGSDDERRAFTIPPWTR